MKRILKYIICILCVILAFILLRKIGIFNSVYDNIMQSVERNRPAESYLTPDFSGTITDVRITAVERETNATSFMPGDKDSPFYRTTCVQIYYGYQKDGEWVDIPSENYDLRAIRKRYTGYEAANWEHIVRIGPYLLISAAANAESGLVSIELTDTLGTEATPMFEEYFTRVGHGPQEGSYSYLVEDYQNLDENVKVWCDFDLHSYIILEMDSIPEDYVLTSKQECGSQILEWTLDYETIMRLLAEA
jgi:hypothetical protein